jgi:hypothetical protein
LDPWKMSMAKGKRRQQPSSGMLESKDARWSVRWAWSARQRPYHMRLSSFSVFALPLLDCYLDLAENVNCHSHLSLSRIMIGQKSNLPGILSISAMIWTLIPWKLSLWYYLISIALNANAFLQGTSRPTH